MGRSQQGLAGAGEWETLRALLPGFTGKRVLNLGFSLDISLDADRLFDRFYTADHVRSRACGLGLALVRQLAEKMGGHCSATLEHGLLDIRVHFPKDSSQLQGPHDP